MNLAIVGSVGLVGNEEAYITIDKEITFYKPKKIISGGARGIDSMAVEVAMAYGIDYEEYLPEYPAWSAFKKRNLKIAAACDRLVRIVWSKSETYGSGWTRDQAQKMGKDTQEYRIE